MIMSLTTGRSFHYSWKWFQDQIGLPGLFLSSQACSCPQVFTREEDSDILDAPFGGDILGDSITDL